MAFRIRVYEQERDAGTVDEVEKVCEAGPSGQMSLFADLLGDPLCRVRNFSAYTMLVAEVELQMQQKQKQIVGMIRAGVKEVACGGDKKRDAKIAFVLGLRVHPHYRRAGIGEALVREVEAWCGQAGAEYAYMATEKDNEASVNLFTKKLGYSKFRTPCILVQPVYVMSKFRPSLHLNRKKIVIEELSSQSAEALYKKVFENTEFFPRDVDAVIASRLHKATWRASTMNRAGDGSWSVLSVWKCNEIFKLEVKGLSAANRALICAGMLAGKFARGALGVAVPTPPDVTSGAFGLQLLYGIHAEGPEGGRLLRRLCWLAHDMARRDGCAVIAAEVGGRDPLRHWIPHWRSLSESEDLWCMKHLIDRHQQQDREDQQQDEQPYDWCKEPPPLSLFMDPRDF